MKKRSLIISAILAATMLLSALALPAAARDYSASDNAGVVWRGKSESGYWGGDARAWESVDSAYFAPIGDKAVVIDGALDDLYANSLVYDIATPSADTDVEGQWNKTVAELAPARADEPGTNVKYLDWEGKMSATMRGLYSNDLVYFFIDVNDSTVYSQRSAMDGDMIQFTVGPQMVGKPAHFAITPTNDGALVNYLSDVGPISLINADSAWKVDGQGNKIGYTIEFSLDMKSLIANAKTGNLMHWFRFIEEQCNATPDKDNYHFIYRDWADWYEGNQPIQAGALVDFNMRVIDCLSKDGDTPEEINANKVSSHADAIYFWSSYANSYMNHGTNGSVGTGRLYMGYQTATNPVKLKGYQKSAVENDAVALRLVYGIDSLEWNRFGFEIKVNDTQLANKEGTTVYTSVYGYDKNGTKVEYDSEDYGSDYFAALVLENISIAKTYTITVRTYAIETINGVEIKHYGDSFTYTVTNGTLAKA